MNEPSAGPARTRIALDAVVPDALAGSRLDQAAAELFPDYSRSRLSEWIKDGALRVDGAAGKPRQPVSGGERLTLEAELAAQVASSGEDIPLDILHVDEHVVVVNKPPGLVVHPGAGNPAGTLQNALLHWDPKLAEVPRAGIVHRLDKDTSGIMVVARTLPAHTALVALLAERDIHRQYEAVIVGELVAGGTVDAPIDRHPRDRVKMAVREGGRPAVTHYRLRERFRGHTLVQVNLETGRTHQIRVHMAHVRHPIVGDPMYGPGLRLPRGASERVVAMLQGFRRQALHAEKLAFAHPVHGGAIDLTAPRPPDLVALIEALRADARDAR